MKTLMLLTVAVAVALMGLPHSAQAQVAEAISLTNQAIVELTDPPALGGRTTVDTSKRWGSDVSVIKSAAAKLQDALGKARSGGSADAIHQLEMASNYAKDTLHKEARLSAQGALYYLCQGGSGDGCDKAPKFGSYTAP